MNRITKIVVMAAVVVLGGWATASAQGAGVGIKGGVVFPDFTTDALELKGRTGWQGGIWFGGNREGVVGVQGEVNFLQNRAESELVPGDTAKLNYLQVPVLLRIHNPSRASGFQVYGIVGPSFDVKISETIEGVSFTSDSFETLNVGAMVGAGIEFARVSVEGRYSRGLRNISKDLEATELKSHSFALLLGVRFN